MLPSITLKSSDIGFWDAELCPKSLFSKLVAHRLIGAFAVRITDKHSLSISVAKIARVLIVLNLMSSPIQAFYCFIRFFATLASGTFRLIHACNY